MVFSSVMFVLVFLPIVLIGHSVLFLHMQNKQEKGLLTLVLNAFLLLSSLFFYAWGEPKIGFFFTFLNLRQFSYLLVNRKKTQS